MEVASTPCCYIQDIGTHIVVDVWDKPTWESKGYHKQGRGNYPLEIREID